MGNLGGNKLSDDGFVLRMLRNHGSRFSRVLENPEKYRFQVLLSEVTPPGGQGPGSSRPTLVRHAFRVDHEYFYPASTVKLCAAIAALQKLTQLSKAYGVPLTSSTPLALYPLFASASVSLDKSKLAADDVERELTKTSMTVAEEVRKIFLVSDNAAFNRLYDFVGHKALNASMWAAGLTSARLRERVSVVCTEEESKMTPAVEVSAPCFRASLPPRRSDLHLGDSSGLKGITVGRGYMAPDDSMVAHPLDFSKKNRISLVHLQDILVQLFVPEAWHGGGVGIRPGFGLTSEHLALLREAMSAYPRHSTSPIYSAKEYPDDWGKFFLPGVVRVRDERALRIFNKIGRAYGFSIDNAYIMDSETGRGFFLSAVLYTNENGILNDDKYEYESLADGFLADLGEVAARTVWQIPPAEYLYQQPALRVDEVALPDDAENGGWGASMVKAGTTAGINAAVFVGDSACQMHNGTVRGEGSAVDPAGGPDAPLVASIGVPTSHPLLVGAIPPPASATVPLQYAGAVASPRTGGRTPRRSSTWHVESAAEVAVAAAEVAAAATLAAAEALAAVAEGLTVQDSMARGQALGWPMGPSTASLANGGCLSPSFAAHGGLDNTDMHARQDGPAAASASQFGDGDTRLSVDTMPMRVAARAEDTSRLAARLSQELSQLAAYLAPVATVEPVQALRVGQGALVGPVMSASGADAELSLGRLFEPVNGVAVNADRKISVSGRQATGVADVRTPLNIVAPQPVNAKANKVVEQAGPRIVSCHRFWGVT